MALTTTAVMGDLDLFDMPNKRVCVGSSVLAGAGRALFATGDIEPGQEIFRTTPLVSHILLEMRESTCDGCHYIADRELYASMDGNLLLGQQVPVMKRCPCDGVKYCSKECQRFAWRQYHKEECKVLRSQAYKEWLPAKENNWRTVCRLLCMYKLSKVTSSQSAVLRSLLGYVRVMQHEDGSSAAECAAHLKYMTGSELPAQDICDLFWIVRTNGLITFCEGNMSICPSIDLIFSLINNSCEPNASYFIEGRELRVRSVAPIKSGQEITVTYLGYNEEYNVVAYRQACLQEDYGFVCSCERCLRELQEEEARPLEVKVQGQVLVWVQRKLNALIKSFIKSGYKDPYGFKMATETEMRRIYPNGDWPATLEPAASIEFYLTPIHNGLRLEDELFKENVRATYKHAISPCVAATRLLRTDALNHLRRAFEMYLPQVENGTVAGRACPLKPSEYRYLLEGILVMLVQEAEWVFGADVAYVQRQKLRLQVWRDRPNLQVRTDSKIAEFRRRLVEYQDVLLRWCKVPEDQSLSWVD